MLPWMTSEPDLVRETFTTRQVSHATHRLPSKPTATDWSIAPQHHPDFVLFDRTDGMSRVVSSQLFSHGFDWSTICGEVRGQQGNCVDERLALPVPACRAADPHTCKLHTTLNSSMSHVAKE